MSATVSPHLHAFDLPASSGDGPDTTRLLVGEPEARIGAVRCAWSNVPVRPPRRKRSLAPAIGFGLFAFIGGLIGAFALLSAATPSFLAPLYTLLNSNEALGFAIAFGVAAIFGYIGWTLGGRIGSGPGEQISYFIGEDGFQRNTLTKDRVRTETVLFAERWAAYERVHKFVNGQDWGVFTHLRFVARDGGAPNVRVMPAVSAAVRAAATEARLAAVQRAPEAAKFPIFRDPGGEWTDLRATAGHIAVHPDAIELSDGRDTRRVPISQLSATLTEGDLELVWPDDRARVRLGWIGDGVALLALLTARGVMAPAEL